MPPEAGLVDYAALAATPLAADPFPHLVVPGFVPAAALAQIYADFPRRERGGSFPPQALPLGPTARALMREMEAPRLRHAIGAKLGLDLNDAPTMLTVRVYSRAKDGRIHTDSTAKRVTVLLYLNPEQAAFSRQEGCLRLLRGPEDIDDYAVEVPPTNGTLLAFPNSAIAYHGHLPFVGRRASLQLNYMAADGSARSELRRHKLSAFLKGLTAAGVG